MSEADALWGGGDAAPATEADGLWSGSPAAAPEDTSHRFTAYQAQAAGVSPEVASQAIPLAYRSDRDPLYVAQNFDMVRDADEQRQMAAHLAAAPALSQYAQQSAAHAAAVKDDYKNLSLLEWLVTGKWDLVAGRPDVPGDVGLHVTPPAPLRALQQGVEDIPYAYHAGRLALGIGTPEDQAEVERHEREQRDLAAESLPAQMLVGSAKALPGILGIVGAGAVAGPEGVFAALLAQGFGPLYRRIKAAHPDIPDEQASAYAGMGAGIGARLASAPALGFVKNLPGVKEAISDVGTDAVARSIPQIALKFAGEGTKHVTLGALTVAAQSAADQAAVEFSGGPANADWSRIGDAAGSGFKSGLVDMGALALITPGRELLADLGRFHGAARERATLDAMEEAAKASKLAQRSPEEAERVLSQAGAQPGATPLVFADFEAVKKDPEVLAAVTRAAGQGAVDEAAATQGDVAIPIGKYLSQLVGEGHAEKLKDDVKLSPDGWTPRQAQEWQEAHHGTPHTFVRFDLSQIGTGQGNQLQGRGIYFAQVRDTAKEYRDRLSEPAIHVAGEPVAPEHRTTGDMVAIRMREGQDARAAIAETIAILREQEERGIRFMREQPEASGKYEAAVDEVRSRLAFLQGLDPARVALVNPGNVYRAAIPSSDQLLDWDKPVAEQPPNVRKALEAAGLMPEFTVHPYGGDSFYAGITVAGHDHRLGVFSTEKDARDAGVVTGGQIYDSLQSQHSPEKASQMLRELGIPGLQYQGATQVADGSHNFVVWDESKMRILADGEPLPGTPTTPTLPAPEVLRQYADAIISKKPIGQISAARYKQQERRADDKIHKLAEQLAAGAPERGTTETKVVTPQAAQGEAAHYDVIEARDLITSHRADTFAPESRFPQGVQERDYQNQIEEQRKVEKGEQNLDPDLLLANAPTAVDGPPLVTSGGTALVLGGNSRSMMLQRAYGKGAGEKYKTALLAQAQAFGLDPKKIQGMKEPVLVRRIDALTATSNRGELAAAVRRFNEGMTQQLSPRLRAVAESRILTPATVSAVGDLLASSPDSSLRDLMRSDPQAFVRILERDGVITDQNRPQFLASGALTDEGKDRIEGMFLGRVMGTGERLGATAPSLTAKVERAVPQLLRVEGANPSFGEIGDVQGAIDLLNDAAKRGLSLDDLLAQGNLFKNAGEEAPPRVVAMARLLAERGQKDVAARFKAWADAAAFDPRQQTMFSKAPTEPEAIAKLFAGMVVDTSGKARPADAVEAPREEPAAAPAQEAAPQDSAAAAKEEGPTPAEQLQELENGRTMARHLIAAADAATKKADSAVEYLRSRAEPDQQKIFARAPAAFRDAADSLLSAVAISRQGVQPEALEAALGAMKGQAVEAKFNVEAIRALLYNPRDVKTLTLGEVQNVANALRQIRYLARRANQVAFGKAAEELQNVVERVGLESRDLPDQALIPSDESTVGKVQTAGGFVEAFQAALRGPERLWAKLGNTGQRIFEKYVERRNYRDQLDREVTAYYEKAWDEGMPEELKARRYEILDLPELPMPNGMDPTRSRTWLWKLMLHMGTESNRIRVRDGFGWTDEQILGAAAKHLSREDLGFIQSIWTFNDKHLWPLVAELEKRVEGAAPEKIQALPFSVELADGSRVEMQGGYFPLKRDRRPGVQPDADPQGPARFLMQDYARASTAHPFTEAREERAKYIVNLQWNDVPGHIQQVIHDLAFREYVLDTARVLDDPGFQRLAVQKLGSEAYDAMVADLRVMANGRAETSAQNMNKLTQLVGVVRSRVATASVVGSMPVLLGQFTHPFVAMAAGEISPAATAAAFVKAFNPRVREEAQLVFPELQHRFQTNQQNYRQMLGNVGPRGNVGPIGRAAERVRVIAHGMQQIVDNITSTQIALARYSDLQRQGITGEAAVEQVGQTVRKMMPTHDIAEQSAVLRDRGVIGSLLMFHGFLNKLYNVAADRSLSTQMAMRDRDWVSAAKYTGQVLGMLAMAGLGRYVMGRGAKEDEDTSQYLAKEALLMPSELVPFGRDAMAPFVDAWLSDKTIKNAFRDAGDITFPALGQYRQLMRNIGTAADSDQENEDRLVAAINVGLTAARIPSAPVRTGQYLYDVFTSREQPQDPAEFASGFIYGSHPNQRANPVRDLHVALR